MAERGAPTLPDSFVPDSVARDDGAPAVLAPPGGAPGSRTPGSRAPDGVAPDRRAAEASATPHPARPRPAPRRHPTLRQRLRALAHPAALGRVLFWGLAPFLHATLAALFLGCLALAALSWRLQQGPLALPAVASALEAVAGQGGLSLKLAAASISWAPPDGDEAAPLVIGVQGATLPDASGTARLQLPAAEARLPVAPLLRGQITPATVTLLAPSLVLELGAARTETPAEGPAAARARSRWSDPLEDLLRPHGPDDLLSVLRGVRVDAASLEVRSRHGHTVATFTDGDLRLNRTGMGELSFEGGGQLRIGAAAGRLRFSGRAGGQPGALELNLALPTIRPAELAEALPSLRPLADLDAPLSLDAALRYDEAGAHGQARLRVGEGRVLLPGGGTATLRGGDDAVEVMARLDGLGPDFMPWGEVSATLRGGALDLPGTAQLRLPIPAEGTAAPSEAAGPAAVPPAGAASTSPTRPAARRPAGSRSAGTTPPGAASNGPAASPVPAAAPVPAAPTPAAAPAVDPATGAARLVVSLAPPDAAGRRPVSARFRLGAAALSLPGAGTVLLGAGENRAALDLPDLPDPAKPTGTARLRLGPGSLQQPDGSQAGFREAALSLEAVPGTVTLRSARLALAPAGSAPDAPVLTAQGEAHDAAAGWSGALDLALDRVAVADLHAYWPTSVAPGGRAWIVENITSGTARDGRWHLSGSLPGTTATAPAPASTTPAAPAADAPGGPGTTPGATPGGHFRLDGMTGTLALDDATVHWLRPIPPLEHVSGTVNFTSPAEIVVQADRARQRGTAITVDAFRMRLYDLDGEQEKTALSGRLNGPLRDMLRLVAHPRLHLLDSVPVDPAKSGGRAQVSLDLAFPLLADLPAERLDVHARGQVEDASLGDLVLDQALRRGRLALDVTQNGMTIGGTADLGPIRGAKMDASMDFRDGAPGQLLVRAHVQGPADLDALHGTQLDPTERVGGGAAMDIQVEQRRGGDTTVAVRGDLRDARLSLAPLNWRKAPGAPASLDLALRLHGDELRQIDRLRVEAPDLAVDTRIGFAPGSRTESVAFRDARIGQSRLSGELRFPPSPGGVWGVRLNSAVLDLRGVEPGDKPDAKTSDGTAGDDLPKVDLDAQVDRLLLRDRVLEGVGARVRQDGAGVVREARVSAASAGRNVLSLEVSPRPGGGRDMLGHAEDLGGLLAAAGLTGTIDGGRLEMRGAWPADTPAAPLTGTAELTSFGLHGLGGAAKLLQALSIYGIPEALSGPGLRVRRLHLPFTLTPSTLSLRDARLTSASLGATLTGRLQRPAGQVEASGTIVPSYALNSLPGRIPLIGRLFTAEPGGGLLAATFRLHGPVDDPTVTVNPLSLLAPGALRGLFEPKRDGAEGR
ncbi:AsmA-like C-terminal region-containing protein [Roseomonas elaeocarpi]|uniref:AsmA-like C-terminal region-containing protein n=1 Tax=Roseomonas elaeocarpi TaxID=907779 RepID=A0ABV6JTV2_9PROT